MSNTATQQRKAAVAKFTAKGLRYVKSWTDGVAGETFCVNIRKGTVIVELHTELPASQATVRNALQQVRAAGLLGVELTSNTPDLWVQLTPAQQAAVAPTIFGYEYQNA